MMPSNRDIADAVDCYIAIWNLRDRTARAQAVRTIFTADATYTDPIADVAGHDDIDAVISIVQTQFSGCAFKLLGKVNSHHRIARFSWELVSPENEFPEALGSEIAIFTDRLQIKTIYAFLDKLPNDWQSG